MYSREEYQKLVAEVLKHDRAYFVDAKPIISDYEYDKLVEKFQEIEKLHPHWITPSSPTQRPGGAVSKGFSRSSTACRCFPWLIAIREEVEDFVKRVHKLLGHARVTFCAELKWTALQ